MHTYKLNGVWFTEDEIKLLLTINNVLKDGIESKTELNFSFDCKLCHISVLQQMARWLLTHEYQQECCITAIRTVIRTNECASFEDMCAIYRACEFFEFELLIKPMYVLLSEELKHDPEALAFFIKSFQNADDFTQSEKQAHSAELQQMKRVIPKYGLHNGSAGTGTY